MSRTKNQGANIVQTLVTPTIVAEESSSGGGKSRYPMGDAEELTSLDDDENLFYGDNGDEEEEFIYPGEENEVSEVPSVPEVSALTPGREWTSTIPMRRPANPRPGSSRGYRLFMTNVKLSPCAKFNKMSLDDIAEPEDSKEKSAIICFASLLYVLKIYIDERKENKDSFLSKIKKKSVDRLFAVGRGRRRGGNEEEDEDDDAFRSIAEDIFGDGASFSAHDRKLAERDIADLKHEIGYESFSNRNGHSIKIAEVKIEPVRSRTGYHHIQVVRLLMYVYDNMFHLGRYIRKWINSNNKDGTRGVGGAGRGGGAPSAGFRKPGLPSSWLRTALSKIKSESEYVKHLAMAELITPEEIDAYMNSEGTFLIRTDCPIKIEEVFSIRKETIEKNIADVNDVEYDLIKPDRHYQPPMGDVFSVPLGDIVHDPLKCFKMPLYGVTNDLYEIICKGVSGYESMKKVESVITAEEVSMEREVGDLERGNFIYRLRNENRRIFKRLETETKEKIDSANTDDERNSIVYNYERERRSLEYKMLDTFIDTIWNIEDDCTETCIDMIKYWKNSDREKILPDFESDTDLSPFGRFVTGFRDRYQMCFDMRKDETVTHFLYLWFAATNCYAENRDLGLNILTTGGPQTSKSENFKNLEKCSIGTVRWADHLTMGAFTSKEAIHDENLYVQDEADAIFLGGDSKTSSSQNQVLEMIKTMMSKRFVVTIRQNTETMKKVKFYVSTMCNFALSCNDPRSIMKEGAAAQRSRLLPIHKTTSQSKYSSDCYKMENNVTELIGYSIMRDGKYNRPFVNHCHFLQFCDYMYNMLIKLDLVPDVPGYAPSIIISIINRALKNERMDPIAARDFERILCFSRECAINTANFIVFGSSYKWSLTKEENPEFNPYADKIRFGSTKADLKLLLSILLNRVRKLVYVTQEMVVFSLGIVYPSVCNDELNVIKTNIIDDMLSQYSGYKINMNGTSSSDVELEYVGSRDEVDDGEQILCRVYCDRDTYSKGDASKFPSVDSYHCDLNYFSIPLNYTALHPLIKRLALKFGCLETLVYCAITQMKTETITIKNPYIPLVMRTPSDINRLNWNALKALTFNSIIGDPYYIRRSSKSEELSSIRIEPVTKGGMLHFNILHERVRNFNLGGSSVNSKLKRIISESLSSYYTPKEGKKLICSFPVEGDPYVLDVTKITHDPENYIIYSFPKTNFDVGHPTFSLMSPEEIAQYGGTGSLIPIHGDIDECCHRKTMELYSLKTTDSKSYERLQPSFTKYRNMVKSAQKLLEGHFTPTTKVDIEAPDVYPDDILDRRRISAQSFESQKYKSKLDIVTEYIQIERVDENEDIETVPDLESEKGKEVVQDDSLPLDDMTREDKNHMISDARNKVLDGLDKIIRKDSTEGSMKDHHLAGMGGKVLHSSLDKRHAMKRKVDSYRDINKKMTKIIKMDASSLNARKAKHRSTSIANSFQQSFGYREDEPMTGDVEVIIEGEKGPSAPLEFEPYLNYHNIEVEDTQ
jgi:hypothetical protein